MSAISLKQRVREEESLVQNHTAARQMAEPEFAAGSLALNAASPLSAATRTRLGREGLQSLQDGGGRSGMVLFNGLRVGGYFPCPHPDTTVNLELLN